MQLSLLSHASESTGAYFEVVFDRYSLLVCRNLYDVFCNIRDDELEHVKTMKACRDYSITDDLAARRLTSSFQPADSLAPKGMSNGNGKGASNGSSPLEVTVAVPNDGGTKTMDKTELS